MLFFLQTTKLLGQKLAATDGFRYICTRTTTRCRINAQLGAFTTAASFRGSFIPSRAIATCFHPS